MRRVRTTEAAEQLGEEVRLQGWLHQFRALGKVNFLIVRDGWGTFQSVVDDVFRILGESEQGQALMAAAAQQIRELGGTR